MSASAIEWTDFTWNSFVGCSKISDGCKNCYAIRQAARVEAMGAARHYAGVTERTKGGPANWSGKVVLAPDHIVNMPLRLPPGALVFVNSMSDFFHAEASDGMRERALETMAARPDVVFQIVTKRPEFVQPFLTRCGRDLPSNIWLGTTVESSRYVGRVATLRSVSAAVRFLSVEPLLDDVSREPSFELEGIDWVIVGGERARPMHAAWVRRVRDICVAAGTPLFFKQWGGWRNNPLAYDGSGPLGKKKDVAALDNGGKGGALLDGREWREMPALHERSQEPLNKLANRRLDLVSG